MCSTADRMRRESRYLSRNAVTETLVFFLFSVIPFQEMLEL